MCGINVMVGERPIHPDIVATIPDVIKRRGPDCSSTHAQSNVILKSSVLHLRGDCIATQPQPFDHGVLCWNGEVYEYRSQDDDKELREVPLHQSDTDTVLQLLQESLQQNHQSTLQAVTSALSSIWNGEFAFCFLTKKYLYYGRDRLGRRSLLLSKSKGLCKISSVATSLDESWQEIAPGVVFELDLIDHCIRSKQLVLNIPPKVELRLARGDNYSKPEGVPESMWIASLKFEELLLQAVKARLICCRKEPIGLLFSGGLDSAVLAGMTAKLIPDDQPLELYNVAFGDGKAADREAGLACYKELKSTFPGKDTRLVLVDIDEWKAIVDEEEHVQQLIFPKTSVMDLNIGTALWFASRGVGRVDGELYKPKAKILLLGMGADEQLGGYGRHRRAHKDGKLREELDLDISRIWERNLGRDDRVLSDHGKEARFPFLDANVMQFLVETPLDDISDFALNPGEGDKRILRLIASRMNLNTASQLVKRAIQFGSRIAHLSDKKRFGSRRRAKGTSHYGEGSQ
mmetsp:Transcript_4404/g.6843  ORF Transcript_4404/g.6843 Transcript_4404/m.6843 type:complete len:517 (-) Transcript_4404:2416-3966(-)